MQTDKDARKSTKADGPYKVISDIYLVIYNSALSIAWALVLLGLCKNGLNLNLDLSTSNEKVIQESFSYVEVILKIAQTAAVLEILHCIIRIVPSSPVLTGMQIFSRLFVLWMVTVKVPSTQKGPGVLMYLVCWSVTEVIRYPYYVFNIFGSVPYALIWCRYTFFYVLYPLGVCGEMLTIYSALAVVKSEGTFSVGLPNIMNFAFNFYYFLIFVLLSYIPLFPQLYFHMVAQRKKYIGGKAKKQ